MDHRTILLATAAVDLSVAAVVAVRGVRNLVTSYKRKTSTAPERRLRSWTQVCLLMVIAGVVLPIVITSNWRWQMVGILLGLLVWCVMVALNVRIQFINRNAASRGHKHGQ